MAASAAGFKSSIIPVAVAEPHQFLQYMAANESRQPRPLLLRRNSREIVDLSTPTFSAIWFCFKPACFNP